MIKLMLEVVVVVVVALAAVVVAARPVGLRLKL